MTDFLGKDILDNKNYPTDFQESPIMDFEDRFEESFPEDFENDINNFDEDNNNLNIVGFDFFGENKKFATLNDFVEGFILPFYNRPLYSRYIWCKKYFLHKEAVLRLYALWDCFEIYYASNNRQMFFLSSWIVQHCDPQISKLFDTNGCFKGCNATEHSSHPLSALPSFMDKS